MSAEGLLDNVITGTDGADIDYSVFLAFLKAYNSPAVNEAPTIYQAAKDAGVSAAAMLGMFAVESKCGTVGTAVATHSWGNTRQVYDHGDRTKPLYFGAWPVLEQRTEQDNAGNKIAGLYPLETPGRSGTFPVFKNWTHGAEATFYRLTDPSYVYAQKHARTLRQIIPLWAPSDDLNDPTGYAQTVASIMQTLYTRDAERIQNGAGDGTNLVHWSTEGRQPHGKNYGKGMQG